MNIKRFIAMNRYNMINDAFRNKPNWRSTNTNQYKAVNNIYVETISCKSKTYKKIIK